MTTNTTSPDTPAAPDTPRRRGVNLWLSIITTLTAAAITYQIGFQAGTTTATTQARSASAPSAAAAIPASSGTATHQALQSTDPATLQAQLEQATARADFYATHAPLYMRSEILRTLQEAATAPPGATQHYDATPYHLTIYTAGCTPFGNTYLLTLTGPTRHYDRAALLHLAAQETQTPSCDNSTTLYLFDNPDTQTQAITLLQQNQDPAPLASAYIHHTPNQYTLTTPQGSTPL